MIALLTVFGVVSLKSYVASFYLGIYPDEVAFWRTNGQVFNDQMETATLFPTCEGANHVPLPKLFLPGAVVYDAVFGHFTTTRYAKWVGFAIFSLWYINIVYLIFGVSFLIYREKVLFSATALGLMSLGVLPYVNVMTRPEMMMLLVVSILLTWTVSIFVRLEKWGQYGIWPVLFFFFFPILSLLFFVHPKGIFIVPVLTVLFAFGFRYFRVAAAAGVLLVIALTLTSRGLFEARAVCPEIKDFKRAFWGQYLEPGSFAATPGRAMLGVFQNFSNSGLYIGNVSFQNKHVENWLPPLSDVGRVGRFANRAVMMLCLLFAFFTFALTVWTRNLLAIALWVTLLGLGGIQILKNFYEAPFVIALLIMILTVQLPDVRGHKFWRPALTILSIIVITVSVISQVALHRIYPRRMMKAYTGPGLSFREFERINPEQTMKAAEKCGIVDPARFRNIVVDDMTFLPLRKSRNIRFWTYLLSAQKLGGREHYEGTFDDLRKIDASAVVVRCPSMNSDLLKLAKKEGEICCLDRDTIQAGIDP